MVPHKGDMISRFKEQGARTLERDRMREQRSLKSRNTLIKLFIQAQRKSRAGLTVEEKEKGADVLAESYNE